MRATGLRLGNVSTWDARSLISLAQTQDSGPCDSLPCQPNNLGQSLRIPHTAMADNVEPRMDLRLGGVVLIVSRGVLANKDDARGNVTQIKLFVDPQALTAKLL